VPKQSKPKSAGSTPAEPSNAPSPASDGQAAASAGPLGLTRRDLGSWLDGPGAGLPIPEGYPGQRLGLPESGPDSVGRVGRRLAGITIDWAACSLLAALLWRTAGAGSFGPLLVLFLEHALMVGLTGASLGHRLVGLRLHALDGGAAGLGRAGLRAALLCLFLPTMFWNRDQRGLHDQWSGTVLVRVS
jgi:hypothetical protein